MADLQELKDLRTEYMAAERAILTGQTYAVEGLSVTRPDLDTVIHRIKELDREIAALESKGRPGVMTPRWN